MALTPQEEIEMLELEEEEYQARLPAQPKLESKPGVAQTALEGLAQGASMGYLPQMQAKFAPKIYEVLNTVTGQDIQPDSYIQERDSNIARQAAQAEANPGTAGLSKLLGTVSTGLAIPGAQTVKGAALAGGALGAAYNPGDTQGVVDPIQAGPRTLNALLGGATGGLIKGAEKSLGSAADFVMQKAANIKKGAPGIGTELMDQGVFGTSAQMKEQVARKLQEQGSKLSGAVSSLGDEALDISPIAQNMQKEVAGMRIGGQVPDNLRSAANAYQEIADFASTAKPTPSELLKFKQLQGDLAYNASGTPGASYTADAAKKASAQAGEMLKSLYSKASPTEGNKIAEANKALSALYKAKKGLDQSRSLTDTLLTGGGLGAAAITANPIGALAAGIAGTNVGRAAAAYGLRGAGKAAGKVPAAAVELSLLEALRKNK